VESRLLHNQAELAAARGTVEVLLNEGDTVRYVRAEHVYPQAGHVQEARAETASWRDWRTAKNWRVSSRSTPASQPTPQNRSPQLGSRKLAPQRSKPPQASRRRLPARWPPSRLLATVVAKWFGQPSRQVVGEAMGTVDTARDDGFDAIVQCEGLPVGTYRLEATLRLDGADDHIPALFENAVLEVLPGPGRQPAPERPTLVPLL
jgi:hypothetical protein